MKFREMMAQLKVDLKTMTFREKVEHIWTNFKEWILIVSGVFVLLLSYVVTLLTNQQPVLSGYMLNVELSEGGKSYICEDFFASIGGSKKQKVDLVSSVYLEKPTGGAIETNYAVTTQMAAVVSAQSLDFLLADEVGMKLGISMELYMDLRDFLTAEELDQWKDKLIYAQAEGSSERIPVAVNISEIAFVKANINTKNPVYIGFVANTPHKENCRSFWEFLLNYE